MDCTANADDEVVDFLGAFETTQDFFQKSVLMNTGCEMSADLLLQIFTPKSSFIISREEERVASCDWRSEKACVLHVRAAGIAASTLNIHIRFKYILFDLLHVGLTEEGRIGSARVAVARFLNALRRIATKERCAADNRGINESCWPKPVANPSEYYFKSDKGQSNVCAASRVDISHRT